MTAANFGTSLKRVLVYEGGKVDHPRDPGGRTNQGVTQRVYNGWRQQQGKAQQDVYDMLPAERDAIYRRGYWDKIQGDLLPAGIDFVVFDGAVNSGVTQSVKWLQRALMMNNIDGSLGDATLTAIENHSNHDQLVADICARRMVFLRQLSSWSDFGKGWTARVAQVKRAGQAQAMGGPEGANAITPSFFVGGNSKAPIEKAKPLPAIGAADAASGGGFVAGGSGGALDTAKDALMPLGGSGGWIDTAITVLVVGGVVMVIGGLAYRYYASRKAHARADALDLPAGVTA